MSQTIVVLHLYARVIGEGDEHPAMLSLVEYGELYFTLPFVLWSHASDCLILDPLCMLANFCPIICHQGGDYFDAILHYITLRFLTWPK